jgi:hypothetical protein
VLRQGTRLLKVVISQTSCEEVKILEANIHVIKEMPKVNFQIDEMTFISKEKQNIYLYDIENETDISKFCKETNIVDFASRHPFVLILKEFQFSVLN